MIQIYRKLMRCGVIVSAFVAFVAGTSSVIAASPVKPSYVPNQLIIKVTPGTTGDALNTAVDKLGAKLLRSLPLADTYLVELLPTRGLSVESAMTRSSGVSGIVSASPNLYRYPCAIPNDPRWNELWGLKMIRCPEAWNTVKGKSTVIAAVVDTGVSITHPDLQGRLLPGRDTADGDDDVSPPPTYPGASHGTHVSGTIGAQGNNNIGVVGVCWDGVKILPVKVFPDAYDPAVPYGASISAIVDGLDWAMKHGAQVVNLSLGSPDPSQAEQAKIQELVAQGIIVVAAAGNDSGPVGYPAAYEECIAVSALGPTEAPAYYTCFGPQVDIAAPGGDQSIRDSDGILSTVYDPKTGNGYEYYQGTSMATPHVTGAVALLLSAGISPTRVVSKMYKTARAPKTGAFNRDYYGNGILDVYSALYILGGLDIVEPKDAEAVLTTTPVMKIAMTRINASSLKVYLDYTDLNKDGLPDDPAQNIVLDGSQLDSDPQRIQYDAVKGTVTIAWPLIGQSALLPGTHTLCVTADPSDEADPGMAADWTVFFVQPKVISMGRRLISIPYPIDPSIDLHSLFNSSDYRLARYIPSRSDYATMNWPGKDDDPLAWPANPGVHPEGLTTDTPPVGLGFWYDNASDTPLVINGTYDATRAYEITLTRGTSGWNLIGDPFPFSVAWESVKVRYQGKTLALKDAIAADWIRPALYRYDTSSGYTFQTPPSAMLMPWEGHWVRILPNNADRPNDQMVLIVPPLDSHEGTRAAGRVAASNDDWSVRLVANAKGVVDSNNVLGVNSRAADGYDKQDVETPPVLDHFVDLSFVHRDWATNAGKYTSDVRCNIGTGKSWDFEVNTDMVNTDVTITWPDISSSPKKYSLVLEDTASGSRVFMRTRASYTYNSGSTPGPRLFKVRVEPVEGSRLVLTNVAVSRTKGSTVSISYAVSRDAQVEVRLRDTSNRVIRTVGGNSTRAAGLNSVHWDGMRDDGSLVSSGLYLAEIVATSQDGEVAKAIRPILIGR